MSQTKRRLEVCFSPALFHEHEDREAIVVVIDVLRASSSITAAFANGVERVIPVSDLDEARKYKDEGFLLAAERDGKALDFADFGNDPSEFANELVRGKTIVYTTTNGTKAVNLAADSHAVLIASFNNHSAVAAWLRAQSRDVILLCAGWKDRFSYEDAVYAGALCSDLLIDDQFISDCDSAHAACDLWQIASKDLRSCLAKFSHAQRLNNMGLSASVDSCLRFDLNDTVPVYSAGEIRNANKAP